MSEKDSAQKTVVAIEDEPAIAELLAFVLDTPVLKVVHCHDGKVGLETIKQQRPDLIIMDVMLPGLNGWQVYEAVRADDHVKQVPILILSVTGQEFERQLAFRNSTIDFFMNKPFDARALRRLVEEILGLQLWEESYPKPL